MVTSNLWTPVGFHNVTRGKVLDFFYMSSDGPRYQTLPEGVVAQFNHLEPDMPAFLEDHPGSVAIPSITAERTKPSGNEVFTRTQLVPFEFELDIHYPQKSRENIGTSSD